jgi:peroxiredoxin
MQRVLIVLALVLLLATGLLYVFKDRMKEAAYEQITRDMFIPADTDQFDPGPAMGSRFPGVHALYQGQEVRLLTPFAGEHGTVLVALRSLDWCPFCMKQMRQLQQYKADFDAAGIGLVAITYDAPALQQAFIDRNGISIPVLSDIDALTFKTLGILNEQYSGDEFQYGIPHPGMIVIDPRGVVVGKLFVEAYSSRVDSAAALAYALRALGRPAPEPPAG